ncbi:MAG: hypothetical protein H7199_08735 [Burkholderiales bacterium]|nr:hypothetical protein [Flavobacterium sp.]
MLLVLLSWCYIFFTIFNLGVVLDKLTRLQNSDQIVFPFLGLFFVTLSASVWAIFGRINIEFQCFLLLFHLIIGVLFKADIISSYVGLLHQIKELSKSLKVFILLQGLILLWQSASNIYFTDNETYYIQTIKWLNEYGFVNGLANLHIFFGQTSGWHIAQSAFNFSFIYANFNDLNGLCLFLFNVFAIMKLNAYFENKNKLALCFGLLPLANLLLFQFSGVPSPDLAAYLIGFLVFYYFLDSSQNLTAANFQLVFILSIFAVYVKITTLPLLILPVLLFISNFKKLKKQIGLSLGLFVLVLGLLVVKNYILTGYPLFPFSLLRDSFASKATLPVELYDFWFNKAKLYDFAVSKSEFYDLSNVKIFLKWLIHSGVDSVFNAILLLLVFVVPLFLKRFYNTASYWIVYLLMIVQLVLLFLNSPQYRFILHFVIFFVMLILSCFLKNKKMIHSLLFFATIPILVLVFFPVFQVNENSGIINRKTSFAIKNCIFPHSISSLATHYKKSQIGNLEFNSPDASTFIWITGNGALPCLNAKQLRFFENKYGFFPQQKNKSLKSGFYTKKTLP